MADDVAKRLRDMMRELDVAIAEQVDPALLFEIEEALGTIPEPRRGVPLHGMQQIIEMQRLVDESIQESIEAASRAALQAEIVESVMADTRVVAAMGEATKHGAVDGAVPVAMVVMREELARRGLPAAKS
jgi:hypothetical protein